MSRAAAVLVGLRGRRRALAQLDVGVGAGQAGFRRIAIGGIDERSELHHLAGGALAQEALRVARLRYADQGRDGEQAWKVAFHVTASSGGSSAWIAEVGWS